MAASSGSRGRSQEIAGPGAGGNPLNTLANPGLAHQPAADLVARLNRGERSGSDFADVALVLAVRERRLAEAEDRVRAADEEAAGLLDTIRALEQRAANAEALVLARRKRSSLGSDSGGISGDEDERQAPAILEPQIGAAELTGAEIRARDLAVRDAMVVPELLAGEIEDGEITPGGIKATPADVVDKMPRPSPLRSIGTTLPSSMPDELAKESVVERIVIDDATVRSSHEVAKGAQAGVVGSHDVVSEVVAGKRKQELAAASASEYKEQQPLKKPKPAGALGVASEDSDTDSDMQVEEMEEDEAQVWKKLEILKAQVAAWELEYDAADAAQGTLQAAAAAAATPPVEEVRTVIEAKARETGEAAVARFQEQIILCEKRLEEIKDKTEKTEERLCAEIADCKEKAAESEAVLWDEILLARTSTATELEVWKHNAIEAEARIHAASMTVARLCDEIEALKQRASETEMRLQTQDRDIARVQGKVDEGDCKLAKAECWIRVSDFELTRLQEKIAATQQDSTMEVQSQIRRAAKMEEDLRAKIHTLDLKVANLEARGSDISRNDRAVAIDEHNHSPMVPETGVRGVVKAGATKKARRQKGVSFYDEVFKSEMEKRKLIAGNEENEEILKKQAAAAASKKLYRRCLPYMPTQLGSQTVEEDSGEEA